MRKPKLMCHFREMEFQWGDTDYTTEEWLECSVCGHTEDVPPYYFKELCEVCSKEAVDYCSIHDINYCEEHKCKCFLNKNFSESNKNVSKHNKSGD